MIVLPGFVDTHRHVWQTQLRTVATDWSLFDYFIRMRLVYASFYSAEDAYLGNLAGALEALDAGVTTIVDHCHIVNTPEHADEALRGLTEARIRALFCYGLFATARHHPFRLPDGPEWHFDDARRLRRERLASDTGRILFGLAPSEIEANAFETNAREIAFARELGAWRISCHVAMGAYDLGHRFVGRLCEAGLLGEDLLLVHGAALTDRELALIRDAGAGISSTPETELQMGMGFPVAWRALAGGVRAGLGIDIVSNYAGDMFAQMRLALQTERARENAAREARGETPRAIRPRARDVLRLATLGGAEVAGLAHRIGSLEVGKDADVVLIRTDGIHLTPVTNAVGAVVLNATAADVDTVLVGGEVVKRDGRLVGVDWTALRARLSSSRDRIVAGFHSVDVGAIETMFAPFYPRLA
jgi:cytosine/adenosine deaminase-related metal-dependent hydrolase